jgi:hypothetical protein
VNTKEFEIKCEGKVMVLDNREATVKHGIGAARKPPDPDVGQRRHCDFTRTRGITYRDLLFTITYSKI